MTNKNALTLKHFCRGKFKAPKASPNRKKSTPRKKKKNYKEVYHGGHRWVPVIDKSPRALTMEIINDVYERAVNGEL